MTEDLRVDTGLVREAGGRLQEIAAGLPEPPAVHRPAGADALSVAIAAKVSEVVDPVVAQMPVVKAALDKYAQNVIAAAGTYDSVDRQLGETIQQRVKEFDEKFGQGKGSSGDGTPSPTGAVSGPPDSGRFGDIMQMPVQMAQQAAQAPSQMAGLAGGLVQAAQQASQLAGSLGGDLDSSAQDSAAAGSRSSERAPETLTATPSEGAGPVEQGPEIAL